jgi:hypothetical protein
MVLNTTFNNISVISWWSVLLVEENRVQGKNHRPVENHSNSDFQLYSNYIFWIIFYVDVWGNWYVPFSFLIIVFQLKSLDLW